MKLNEKLLFEICTEYWTVDDFLNIDLICDWSYLENHGWILDKCGNARKDLYHISNNGVLTIQKQLSMPLTEWIIDEEFLEQYNELYSLLTQNFPL